MSEAFDDERLEPSERHSGVGAAQRALEVVTNARARGGSLAARLADQFADRLDIEPGAGPQPQDPVGSSTSRWRGLRREAELALDTAIDRLRDAMDAGEEYLRQQPAAAESIESIELSARPGETGNATLWVHNLTTRPWTALVPRLTGLTDLHGETFIGRVSFDPALVPT